MKELVEHLKNCGGCLGKRNQTNCKYTLECAIAESLSKRGLVRDTEELILFRYRNDNRNINFDVLEECTSPDDANESSGIGPCSFE